VQFSANRIDASVAQTRAAVDAWTGAEQLKIYGFKVERSDAGSQVALGSGRYNLTTPFIDNVTAASPATGLTGEITVYRTGSEPFYYSIVTDDVYDFYGYYYGDAQLGTATKNADVISYPVTINGTQDLMYATTDKAQDVSEATAGNTVAVHQAYGAWAARRGVHPTLNFQHALSQFNFKVKRGSGSYTGKLTIKSIDIITPTEGTFTVVGTTPGFVETADATGAQKVTTATDLELARDTEGQPAVAFGTPLMIGPGKDAITIVVNMEAENYTAGENNSNVIVHQMTIPFSSLSNTVANATKFDKGHSYEVTLIVYGPEQVKFDVNLAPWVSGGDVEFDPDNGTVGPAA
jgi:hypothetical protein